jgi:hypothetical protein
MASGHLGRNQNWAGPRIKIVMDFVNGVATKAITIMVAGRLASQQRPNQ